MNYLNRDQAPFDASMWEQIDKEATESAKELLTGRRFLDIAGPYGIGFTSLEVGCDDFCRDPGPDEAAAIGSRAIAVPMLRKQFKLSIRRLAAHQTMGQPLLLREVGDAAEAVARREEELVYYGQEAFSLPGLMTAKGAHSIPLGQWSDLEHALSCVLKGVTQLDEARFPGPYALALSAQLYNGLYRRYTNSDMLQIEHFNRLCKLGVFKAPITGAVLLDARAARLVIGQDLLCGYTRHDGVHCELFASESAALVVDDAKAICVFTP